VHNSMQKKSEISAGKSAVAPSYPDIATLSFEEALRELESIVRRLESGQAELEASITDYTRGMALKDHCQKKLADAKLKVEAIVQNSGGTVTTRPFDAE